MSMLETTPTPVRITYTYHCPLTTNYLLLGDEHARPPERGQALRDLRRTQEGTPYLLRTAYYLPLTTDY